MIFPPKVRTRPYNDRLRWILRGEDDSDEEITAAVGIKQNSLLGSNQTDSRISRSSPTSHAPTSSANGIPEEESSVADANVHSQQVARVKHGSDNSGAVSRNPLSPRQTDQMSPRETVLIHQTTHVQHFIISHSPVSLNDSHSAQLHTHRIGDAIAAPGGKSPKVLHVNSSQRPDKLISPSAVPMKSPMTAALDDLEPAARLNGNVTYMDGQSKHSFPECSHGSPVFRGKSPKTHAERVGDTLQQMLRSEFSESSERDEPFVPGGSSFSAAARRTPQNEIQRRRAVLFDSDSGSDDSEMSEDESDDESGSEPTQTQLQINGEHRPALSKADRLASLARESDDDGPIQVRAADCYFPPRPASTGGQRADSASRRSRRSAGRTAYPFYQDGESDVPTIQFSRRSATPPAARDPVLASGSDRVGHRQGESSEPAVHARPIMPASSPRSSPPRSAIPQPPPGRTLSPPLPEQPRAASQQPTSDLGHNSRSPPPPSRAGGARRPPPSRNFAAAAATASAEVPPTSNGLVGESFNAPNWIPPGADASRAPVLQRRVAAAAAPTVTSNSRFSRPFTSPLPARPAMASTPRSGRTLTPRRTLTPGAHSRLAARLLDASDSDSDKGTAAADCASASDTDTDSLLWSVVAAAPCPPFLAFSTSAAAAAAAATAASSSAAPSSRPPGLPKAMPAPASPGPASGLRAASPPPALPLGGAQQSSRFRTQMATSAVQIAASAGNKAGLANSTPRRDITTPGGQLREGTHGILATGSRTPAASPPPSSTVSLQSPRRVGVSPTAQGHHFITGTQATAASTRTSSAQSSRKRSDIRSPTPSAAKPESKHISDNIISPAKTQPRGPRGPRLGLSANPTQIPSLGSEISARQVALTPSSALPAMMNVIGISTGALNVSPSRGRPGSAMRRWPQGSNSEQLYQQVRAMLDSDDEGD